MTRTRTSVLLTALLIVGTIAAGVSFGAATTDAPTNQLQADDLEDVAVESGEVYWQGQFLQFTGNETNASEVWSIRRVQDGEVGGLATEVLLDGTGSAVFSTAGLDGQFVVVDAEGQPVVFQNGVATGVGSVDEASFEIASQSLNATFEDAVVRNDQSADARVDFQLRSNRAGYGFYLFSDQLSAEELADIFQSVEVQDGEAVATRNASSNEVFEGNFSGVEPGTYNVTVATIGGTATDTATITVSEPVEGTAALPTAQFTEQRGDVVRFNVSFDGLERATVTLGSRDVGYLSRFTVVDANGDGEATVELDTFRAGISADAPGISMVGEDELANFELVTDPIPGRLDAATYPIEVSVASTRTAVGSITLQERSTEGVQVWTAPDTASIGQASQISDVATQDTDIAYQDWAVVQVQASGLYSYVQNLSDLNNNTTGVSMTLTRLGEINRPSTEVPLDRGRLLVDEDGDQFFLVIDSNQLERNATYQANFSISAANPYVSAENASSYVTNFTVVPRTVSFDQPVEVPASSDATISGSSSVAPGTELSIEAANTADSPFLKRQSATVGEDGSWEATFDFSDVSEGTNFTVSIEDPEANASGVVVGAAGAETTTTTEAPAEETTTAAETTAADEETTAAEDEETGAAEGEETTAAEDEETVEAGDEETAEAEDEEAATEETAAEAGEETTEETTIETTTTTEEAGASAPAPGFGPVTVLLAVVVLLAVGALMARRR